MACADCFKGGVARGDPQGSMSLLHGVNTYIASPAAASTTSTIVLYTDAFGLLLPNNKILADTLAAQTGFRVLVPDIIPGGGMSPDVLPLMDTFSSPAAGYVAKAWSLGRAMVHVVPFFVRASPQSGKCMAACLAYAQAVRGELPEGAKLGLAGYCWGGYQALHIASSTDFVDAVFVAHPAKFEASHALNAVQAGAKMSFAHAGDDMALPMKKIDETKRMLEGQEGWEVRIYEGCVHGFAVRATPEKVKEAKAADEALRQAVDWFGEWL